MRSSGRPEVLVEEEEEALSYCLLFAMVRYIYWFTRFEGEVVVAFQRSWGSSPLCRYRLPSLQDQVQDDFGYAYASVALLQRSRNGTLWKVQ